MCLPPLKQQSVPVFRSVFIAVFYVLSGCSQPLIVTLLKEAGLADSKCQLYMLFYYLMPALFNFPLLLTERETSWPSRYAVMKACGVVLWDIGSTILNYTGASMAGPTIFGIIYSSVTIWTAVFSQIFLGRKMNHWQWTNVLIVFAGLLITATDSVNTGNNVFKGSCFVIFGSLMHGLTYVMTEAVMTVGEKRLTIVQNNFVQASVASFLFLWWQFLYTVPHYDELIRKPMHDAGTTIGYGSFLLLAFGASNIVHWITFLHIVYHFPGGSTSAGVMKGLQAVCVFFFTSLLYCNRIGGTEMCFSKSKFISLVTVTGGVFGYVYTTQTSKATTVDKNVVKRETENSHEATSLI